MSITTIINRIALSLLLTLSAPQLLYATTVLQVDMQYLLNHASWIFEGEVIASEARWNHNETSINTYITFRIDEVIKGDTQYSTVELAFAGGTVGETGLQVSSMVYPPVGEHGIFFLENPDTQLVNPLVGWGQGHFRIATDGEGVERVLTQGYAPVLGLEPVGASGSSAVETEFFPVSHGVARDVQTGSEGGAVGDALNKTQFKNLLKARLASMKTKPSAGSTGGVQ